MAWAVAGLVAVIDVVLTVVGLVVLGIVSGGDSTY
jgi:hypothetical protein